MHVEPRLTAAELEALIRKEKRAKLATRYRGVLLAMRGRTAVEVAEDLCVSRRSVQAWVRRYNHGGPDALGDKPKPGKPRTLSADEEAAVVRWIEQGPDDPGLAACSGPLIRDRIESHFNKPMSLSAAYKILHRLGFEPLRPRPAHRKRDPEAMEAWEERAPFLSGASATPTPASASRSGSRTKRGSASRAR